MIIILYRIKPSIYQTQLTDFIGLKSIDNYDMNVPKDYRIARKRFRWISIHPTWGAHRKQTARTLPRSQRRITDFIQWVPKLTGKYFYRFPNVGIPRFEDYGEGRISKKEWEMHRYLKGFNGFFENLLELNDFSYFDELQETLETEGVSFKNLFIKDIFAYELLRINLGFKNYSGIEKMGKFTGRSPLFSITHDPGFFPTASDLSFVLNKIPAKALFSFFQQLVQECIENRIIVPRILIWDGQFIRSNCSNNKNGNKLTYNDPDAGYCRHIGLKKGVGYDPGIIYAHCNNRWFPLYFKMFSGNRSDIVAFRKTLNDFLASTSHQYQVIVADSGAYSLQNLEEIQAKGLLPIIRSRKNIKTHPVRELKKGFYFNTDFIPKEWSDEYFLKIYNFRPMIEQGNSYNNTYYNASRMNTRGIDAAIRLRSSIYALELLKALIAYKFGRLDLLMKPSAFEASRYLNFQVMLPFLAVNSGFKIFENEVYKNRQNALHYRNRLNKK